MTSSLGVIGCGKMAYALLQGIQRETADALAGIAICDPDASRVELFRQDFQALSLSKEDLVKKSDIIILAVKPNQIKDVLVDTRPCWDEKKLLISIAAGLKTTDLEQAIPDKQIRVVRVMPNTPCVVGEGMSAICSGTFASQADLQLVQSLLNGCGKTIIVPEKDMDAITAVSGSGPAYVFLLIEAMLEAAVNVGLTADTARQLILQTFNGSVHMLQESREHPAVLKAQVCSPAGTTIAGVRQLEEAGVRKAFFNAVEAAYQRSIALGKTKN